MLEIPANFETDFELIVEARMTVDFEQADPKLGKLHPVYSTYWLTKHVELCSRKIILPFLEDHEEGIGFEVSVKHFASALVGMKVKLNATFERQEGKRIYASCLVWNELGDQMATANTTQVVLETHQLEQGFRTLKKRFEHYKARAK